MAKLKISEKEKIITAAIEYIEEHGIGALTVRGVAKKAGVNIAAINYYFGSKKGLIREALGYAIGLADTGWLNILEKGGRDPRLLLKEFMNLCLSDMVKSPGITKAYFYESFVKQDHSGEYFKHLSAFLLKLRERVEALVGKDKEQLQLLIMQMTSAVIFPAMFPEFYKGFAKYDFKNKASQDKYIEHLTGCFFRELERKVKK